jgi:magnesium chelatase subunit D
MAPMQPNFPFAAVAGQAHFKLALILTTINPAIGGVLVSGPRGSAKSTLAKAMADIMPVEAHASSFEKSPIFIPLPLGTTEEMLLGTLNLQQVLDHQKVEFQAGLLAKAHQGVLYVDEVNLLQDNLVDLLLDVAASGVNVVERDGVSHAHAAEFILLGTMNPDEGEIRPQLLDRFGLAVVLGNQFSIAERIEIVKLRESFDSDPDAFVEQYRQEQTRIAALILAAKNACPKILCSDQMRYLMAERCDQANVDGLRADIVWHKAALAHAAWKERDEVTEADVLAVEELVLSHRRNDSSNSPPRPPSNQSPEANRDNTNEGGNFSRPAEDKKESSGDWGSMSLKVMASAAQRVEINSTYLEQAVFKKTSDSALAPHRKGAMSGLGGLTDKATKSVSWFNTLVKNHAKWPLTTLSYKKSKAGQMVLHIVLLDTSASTLQQQLFSKAKAAILSIAEKAYLNREQLTILGFGNDQVETLISRKRAPKALRKFLDNVPAGGGTPLREALQKAEKYQKQQISVTPEIEIITYVITDGRTTQAFADLSLMGKVVVIDIEQAAVKRGKAVQIADALSAKYYPLLV